MKVLGLIGPIMAGVVTLIRLFERFFRKRFGIDDGWAAFALVILIIFEVALFLHLGDPTHLSHLTRVAMYYVMAQGFYAIIWPARMSILFSVVRFTPQHSKLKAILHYSAVSFLILWAILFAQIFWVCEPQPQWKENLAPQCPLGPDVVIAQLVSDIYADSVLIAAPLRLLWNLDVPRSRRNRLIIIFTSSIGTTIASLVHAYYILRVGGLVVVFAAVIEECMSLLVCNLAVISGILTRLVDSREKRSGFSSNQMVLVGQTRTTDRTPTDHVDFQIDLETGTELKIRKIVEVHTDTESLVLGKNDANSNYYWQSPHN